jgi:hypothetical protein
MNQRSAKCFNQGPATPCMMAQEGPRNSTESRILSDGENHWDLQPLWASYGPGGFDALRPILARPSAGRASEISEQLAAALLEPLPHAGDRGKADRLGGRGHRRVLLPGPSAGMDVKVEWGGPGMCSTAIPNSTAGSSGTAERTGMCEDD